jgi:O-antigen/teichoic acid export membrane protein
MIIVVFAILPTMLYLHLFYETDVRQAYGLVSLVFMRSLLRTQFIVFSYPAYYLKKTKIFLYLNSGAMVINLLLNYLLIPQFSYYGAIAAGLISDLIMVSGIFYYQKRIVEIKWSMRKTMLFPLMIILFTVITEIIRINAGFDPFITAVLITMLASSGLIYLYRNELNIFIRKRWKRS